MLAHLTKKRLKRGNLQTGLEHDHCSLRWSGDKAQGDEFDGPVCYVIDVGTTFAMSFDDKLYVIGPGPANAKTFTVFELLHAAMMGWYGLTLRYDESRDNHADLQEEVAAP